MLFLYCALYLFITLITQVSVQYYFFPVYAHVTIIMAICFGKIKTRYLNSKRHLKFFLFFVLLSICVVNVYEIVTRFELSKFAPQLKKQLAIKGCCFYWPGGYFVPSGLKTDAAIEVDKFAMRTIFSDTHVEGGQLKSGIRLNNVPIKAIFINEDNRYGTFPLTSPESYLVYGKDVSYVGLPRLAEEIESKVPQDSKEYAYKGLAVYYVNDNWLADLIEDFKAGIIKDKVPDPYQHYFYSELTRKIVNKYENNADKIKATINGFDGPEREWMLKTKVPFRAFVGGRRVVYQKIDSNP